MTILLLVLSILAIVVLSTRFNLHPFLSLLLVSIAYGIMAGMPGDAIITAINTGFGETLGKIGLVIVLGIIIGVFLEHSGGAFKIAETILKIIGKKRVTPAMGIIGFVVSIPVFADSGFIILNPLNKSLCKKAGISLAGPTIALGLGLMITHTLAPPTPGPVAAAGILKADLGLVLLWGLIVGALTLMVSILFAKGYAARTWIDPGPIPQENVGSDNLKRTPSATLSFLPILVPILLIILKSVTEIQFPGWAESGAGKFISFVGSPVIALIIGMFLAFFLPDRLDKNMLSTTGWVGLALKDTATILLVTGAGGIFGKILQASGIADQLAGVLSGASLGIWLPFILSAAIKTAQGSSTVAMITTASILAPLMEPMGFSGDVATALVVISIGAGSMVISHANDSLFWVLTQLSGMDIRMGYRLWSLGSLVTGFAAATILSLIYLILV